MLDFYTLLPSEFEDLCYEYICALYRRPNYSVEHTRYNHDGGRDIEITFYDELSYFKIWAECKRHKRNIGLEDIGKNVVLIISKRVNKVIFFSASEITEGAQVEISRIADKLNFEVSFLCGERLSKELSTQPALIKKYFGVDEAPIAVQEELTITCSVSEFESDALLLMSADQSSILMKKGELLNIYVHLSNCTAKLFQGISIEAVGIPSAIKIYNAEIKCERLARQADFIAHFRGEILSKQNTHIDLPQIVVRYAAPDATINQKTILLPFLDISKCRHYPLVGKKVTEFLAQDVRTALEWSGRYYPQIFDLRGISGSGKSRLAEEIQKKAARQGFHTLYLNSMDYIEFDLIRKLLCELLHLPFYRGKFDFEQNDIVELINMRGSSDTFAVKIAKFMERGKWEKNDAYYMVESVAHLLLAPAKETGYCITIDNSQNLHPEILKFLIRLTDILSQHQGQVILTIIGNIEREVAFSKKEFQAFLDFFTAKGQEHNRTVITYMCEPLSEADAALLLMHLFHIKEQRDSLLQRLLRKTGRLPFEIIMTLEYFSDMGIIEWLDVGEWSIRDQEKFAEFMADGFQSGAPILDKRETAWHRNHTKAENQKFEDILAAVVCFEGTVPYAYISDSRLDQTMIDELEQLSWLAPNPTGQGIKFFHDNILEFCRMRPRYRKNAKVLKRILRWLNENPETDVPHRERIQFSCLYYLNRFSQAFAYGLNLLKNHLSSLAHMDVVYIGRTLYEDLRAQQEPANFVMLASIYADAIFSLDNKELGCAVYADIVKRIKEDSSILGLTASCATIHRAINSQLQSARYSTAIEWIKMLETLPDLSLKYQFIAKNRYGVTYIALGQFDEAKKYLDEAMALAENCMGDLYWTSTAHSDLALYYFYNWRPLGKKAASERIISEFEMAISDYGALGKTNVSRDIEMAWHRAFINILREDYCSAAADAQVCISLSQENHQAYGLIRGYNLKALAYAKDDNDESAKLCLEEGLHACEVYSFPSGTFRMYNNLGVIFGREGNYKKAGDYFSLAIGTLGQQIEYKQAPVLTNLLMASICQKDNAALRQRAAKCCDAVQFEDLREYRRSLCPEAIATSDSFSFFGLAGFSYIF